MENFKNVFEFINVCSKAEQTNSRNEKIELFLSIGTNIFFKQVARFVFDPLITLAVTTDSLLKIEQKVKVPPVYSEKEIYNGFENLVNLLSSRKVTGNSAREMVSNFLEQLPDEPYRFWYQRFLDKKFVEGFSNASIVKIFPMLKSLEVQTAEVWTPDLNIDFRKSDWISEIKIDGMRMFSMLNSYSIPVYLSRDSKPLPEKNLEFLSKLSPVLKDYVVDGELYAGSWNLTTSIVRSLNPHPDQEKLKFYIFDIIPKRDFSSGVSSLTLKERKELLKRIPVDSRFVIVPGEEITSEEDLKSKLKSAISSGWEGLVIKSLDSPYVCKREPTWLKVKEFHTEDFEIISSVPGTGKYSKKPSLEICKKVVEEYNLNVSAEEIFSNTNTFLGAIVLRITDDKVCNVGSGFTELQRVYLSYLNSKQELLGKICEISFQEKTKDNSLRFPVFQRMRFDK